MHQGITITLAAPSEAVARGRVLAFNLYEYVMRCCLACRWAGLAISRHKELTFVLRVFLRGRRFSAVRASEWACGESRRCQTSARRTRVSALQDVVSSVPRANRRVGSARRGLKIYLQRAIS